MAFDFVPAPQSEGSGALVAKKKIYFTDSLRFNGQYPVSRGGKATRRRAFEVQSAQAISAAYYFDLAARDHILADGAIELVIEGVPCSALIEPSQSCKLIFCVRSDRLRGRKHAADGGKLRRDLQEQTSPLDEVRKRELARLATSAARNMAEAGTRLWFIAKSYAERTKIRRQPQPLAPIPQWEQH